MLRNTKDLKNYAIHATDGEIGQVKDLYFDNQDWMVRYFVAEAGFWLSNRRVLISPLSVRDPDWPGKTLPVSIDKGQVRKSPPIDADKPPSRQFEEQYYHYYGYPYYWSNTGPSDQGLNASATPLLPAGSVPVRQRHGEPQLRSCAAVIGYHLKATDGEIGHVSGFLVDGATWAIRYLVVDTDKWWVDHQVLLAPSWITGMHWQEKTVSVDLSQHAVKASPAYVPSALMDRAWEDNLHQHYGRAGYWLRADAAQEPAPSAR
jgi:uncharacterized protein YrrD